MPKTVIKLVKLQYIHAGRKPDHIKEKWTSLTLRSLKRLHFNLNLVHHAVYQDYTLMALIDVIYAI